MITSEQKAWLVATVIMIAPDVSTAPMAASRTARGVSSR